MNRFYSLPVKEIRRITPKSVTVSFSIPKELENTFPFSAGQHITIKKEFHGTELRRSYSICTSPKSKELKIGVKKVNDGAFSRFINSELREGDVLEVHPPEGRFVFHPDADAQRNIMAFAAGSGITPIMSIMRTVLEEEPKSTFVLVYGNKNLTETMFYDDIAALLKTYPERLTVHFVYSQAQEEQALFGRIERATVNYLLKNKHPEQRFDAFYLCGPEGMITTVTNVLQEHGVAKEQLFFELFVPSAAGKEINLNIPGKTNVTVILEGVETSFVMDKKQCVLDAVLAHHLDAPYSCQGGICSSCMARLKEGKVKLAKNQILTDSDLAEGLTLTCQAHPITDRIIVDYDDV
jgi:ring-1,2-phenylacetyl-CoA epoxidase subunit PaaE